MASELLLRSEARRAVESGRFQELRSAARVSMREIASVVGVTPAAVCRWEARERIPRGEIAARLGRVLRELEASLAATSSEPDGVMPVEGRVRGKGAASVAPNPSADVQPRARTLSRKASDGSPVLEA